MSAARETPSRGHRQISATRPAARPVVVLHVLPHPGGGAETYLEQLRDLDGFDQRRFEIARARTPFAALPSLLARLPRLALARRSADLVHIHGDAAALLALPLLGRTPAVWTTHGLHLLRRRPALAPLARRVVASTGATVCTSEAEARELGRLAPDMRSRLLVVPNGIPLPAPLDDAVRAAVRGELGIGETEAVALFLGELEPRKRPLDAVQAAGLARSAGAPITLLVAGSGPLADTIAERAGPAVRVLGFRRDPQALLAASDMLVLPSAREGHSFALLEAMGLGLAVVAADSPGMREALGEAGIVVPVGDPAALAHALVLLATDAKRRADLGRLARERVALQFTRERLRADVRAAYELALRASRS
jgi:glycosyltransferase involved in cell wall biosynthesis